MRNLEEILKIFARELEKAKHLKELEGYTLIGAIAVSARARPRATKDIDFLVSAKKRFFTEVFPRTITSMGFSYKVFKGGADDPLSGLVRVYDKNGTELVDLIPVFWRWQDEVINHAENLEVFPGVIIPVARIEDLIVLKLKAGGPQDLLDAEELVKAASFGQNLDRGRLLSLAKRAGIDRNLKRFLSKFNLKL